MPRAGCGVGSPEPGTIARTVRSDRREEGDQPARSCGCLACRFSTGWRCVSGIAALPAEDEALLGRLPGIQ
jgi:hypothetical protein